MAFFCFWVGRYNKALNDCRRGKQWVLFPLDVNVPPGQGLGQTKLIVSCGPVINRFLFTHTIGIQTATIFLKVNLWKAPSRAPTARQGSLFPLKLLHKTWNLVCGILHRPSRHHDRLSSSSVRQSPLPLGSFRRPLAFIRLHSNWRHFSAFSSLSGFLFPLRHHRRCLWLIFFVGRLHAIDNTLFSFLCQFPFPGWNGSHVWRMGLLRLICKRKVNTCYIGHVIAWLDFKTQKSPSHPSPSKSEYDSNTRLFESRLILCSRL